MIKNTEDILKDITTILTNELAMTLPQDVKLDSTLASLGVDSIGLMSLIVYLEDMYGCEIELSMEESFQFGDITVGKIVSKITG